MKSNPALKERIVLLLFEDPGMTLGELHKKVWDSGSEILKDRLGRVLAGLKKEGSIHVCRFKERSREIRYRLTKSGNIMAAGLMLE